jgi:hypothetical protein
MFDESVKKHSGKKNLASSWDAIFHNSINQKKPDN